MQLRILSHMGSTPTVYPVLMRYHNLNISYRRRVRRFSLLNGNFKRGGSLPSTNLFPQHVPRSSGCGAAVRFLDMPEHSKSKMSYGLTPRLVLRTYSLLALLAAWSSRTPTSCPCSAAHSGGFLPHATTRKQEPIGQGENHVHQVHSLYVGSWRVCVRA